MKAIQMRKSSIHLIKKQSTNYEEKIASVSARLLSDESVSILALISKEDTVALINHILLKTNRKAVDIMILNKFMRTLTQFMSLLTKNEKRRSDIQPLLNKIGEHLKWKYVSRNTILFRSGDIGSMFYLILHGSVSVLIPNSVKLQLSLDDYMRYLNILLCLKENDLFNMAIESNKEVYNVIVDENKTYKQNTPNPLYFSDYNTGSKLSINYDSCEEYLQLIMPQVKHIESYHPTVVVWVYHKVVELKEGDTFGETALLSRNLLRTATIYTNEETFCGTLNQNEFNSCIKKIQIQIKRERTLFVLSYNLFHDVNYEVFVKRYWNYFTFNQIKQGEILFHQYDMREMVLFLKEGSVELISRMSINELNNVICLLSADEATENKPKAKGTLSSDPYFFTGRELRVAITKNKDIIGLDDVVYEDNRLFCTAICTSKRLSYFAIHIKLFHNLLDIFNCRSMEYSALTDKKKEVMVNRLKTIRNVQLNSIISSQQINKGIQSLIEEFNPLKRMNESRIKLELVSNHLKKKKIALPTVFTIAKSDYMNKTTTIDPSKVTDDYGSNNPNAKGVIMKAKQSKWPKQKHKQKQRLSQNHRHHPILLNGNDTLFLKYIIKANKRKANANRLKDNRQMYLHDFSSVFPDSHSMTVYHSNNTRSISTSMNNSSTATKVGMIDLLINDSNHDTSISLNESKAIRNKSTFKPKGKTSANWIPFNYMLKAKPMTIRLRKAS